MPIVVTVLGVVIVILGFIFFTVSPTKDSGVQETTQTNQTEEMNRTETMEVESETVIETEPLSDAPISVDTESTYTGTGTYQTPARTNHEIDVTLTVKAGIVTDAKVVYDNGDGFSNPNQERFDKAYKTEIIGKPLSGISLSRVGGASLTSEAFNQAVAEIKTQQS